MTGARSGRQLVFLINTHGKTEDEIVEEAMRAWDAWKEREGQTKSAGDPRHETPDGGTPTE